jgi:hypothetical protein
LIEPYAKQYMLIHADRSRIVFSHMYFKPRFCYMNQFFRQSVTLLSSLRLHHFFISIDISAATRTAQLLYNDLELPTHGNSLLATILSIFALP